MQAKPILNNMKQYRNRDASVGTYQKRPKILNNTKVVETQLGKIRVAKNEATKAKHSRFGSCGDAPMNPYKIKDPQSSAKQKLINEHGKDIDSYLKKLVSENAMRTDNLTGHAIKREYRAKMVDWMVEVMSAFKCADQTFFLAVSLMDRYFDLVRD